MDWPLERIPRLNERALLALTHSMAVSERHKRSPLAALPDDLDIFAATSWRDMGFGGEETAAVTELCGQMFLPIRHTPSPDAPAGELAAETFRLWRQGERLVTFFTSGSTGVPKACAHRETLLRQELIGIAPLVEERTSVLVTVPLHHMYGFTFGLLLPMALGVPIRQQPPLPPVVAAHMRPGDLVVGIPLMWTRLAQGTPVEGRNISLFTATSPIEPKILIALRNMGFHTIELFGASETGVMAWRHAPDQPFTLLPHLAPDEEGKALDRTLPDGGHLRYPLLDDINWFDSRHMLPAGRRDQAVQVGGVNVFPRRVEAVLAGHEGVRECTVRLMRPEEGERLKAFVAPAPGWDAKRLTPALIALARAELGEAERPVRYAFGPDLPRGPLGKPKDW